MEHEGKKTRFVLDRTFCRDSCSENMEIHHPFYTRCYILIYPYILLYRPQWKERYFPYCTTFMTLYLTLANISHHYNTAAKCIQLELTSSLTRTSWLTLSHTLVQLHVHFCTRPRLFLFHKIVAT